MRSTSYLRRSFASPPSCKRAGAWGLAPDAPEATRGFLLNHLISELLPGTQTQAAMANADPVTGQAAWYDLRVRLTRAAEEHTGMTEPMFPPLATGLPRPPRIPPQQTRAVFSA